MPSVGSTSPCGQVGCYCSTCSIEQLTTWTPLSLPSTIRFVRALDRFRQLFRLSQQLDLLLVHPEKMPLANLCSRLLLSRAPAGSPTPKLAACAVAPAATCLVPSAVLAHDCRHQAVHDDAGWPLPASPTLGGNAVDAAPTSGSHVHLSPRGAQLPGRRPAPALSASHEPDEATTDAPCHTLGSTRLPSWRQESQDPLPSHLVTDASSPNPGRLPPAGPAGFRPLLARRTWPLGPPLASWLCHQNPASDMRSRTTLCARPKHRAGYSPESPGHMPPTDFCR